MVLCNVINLVYSQEDLPWLSQCEQQYSAGAGADSVQQLERGGAGGE